MSPRNVQFSSEEIIEAALDLVRKGGWSGFSVPAVAKAIGCSTMPVYSHFASASELEDAVCLKALQLLKERMQEKITGDLWVDQAISFVRFAEEERHLFRCMWDGRNVELARKMGQELNDFISATLVDYPLFAGLGEVEVRMIRVARMMFAQKLAYWMSTNSNYLKEKGIGNAEEFIRRTSRAIYDGFRLQFAGSGEQV